jgi:hypothetical protein
VHGVFAGFFASDGHAALVPVQFSATSHSCGAVLQTVVAGKNWSVGHTVVVPLHVSATSQPPATAGRQTVPAVAGDVCWHATLVPSQTSFEHRLPSSVHGVLAAFLASAGHAVLVPVQVSATSHSCGAGRHVVPAFPAGCWQRKLVPLQVSVVQTFPSSGQVVPADFGEQVPTRPLRLQAAH